MRVSKSERGAIIKSHLVCAQNNRGEEAIASALCKAVLINPKAADAKALQRFAF
jgi:hypothetical protein